MTREEALNILKLTNDWYKDEKADFMTEPTPFCDLISAIDIAIETLSKPSLPEGLEMDYLKIKGWIARDDDQSLCFYFTKPTRACYTNDKFYHEDELEEGMIPWVWDNVEEIYFPLPYTMFSELKWEDEPIEVELTIKKI